jgi:hypothetical protein
VARFDVCYARANRRCDLRVAAARLALQFDYVAIYVIARERAASPEAAGHDQRSERRGYAKFAKPLSHDLSLPSSILKLDSQVLLRTGKRKILSSGAVLQAENVNRCSRSRAAPLERRAFGQYDLSASGRGAFFVSASLKPAPVRLRQDAQIGFAQDI